MTSRLLQPRKKPQIFNPLFCPLPTEVSSRPERSVVEGPAVHHPQYRISMEALPSPLSSRAKPRDLQFSGPLMEMFSALLPLPPGALFGILNHDPQPR